MQAVRSNGGEASAELVSAIDYFGSGATDRAQSRATGQEEDGDGGEEGEVESESEEAGVKRKRKDEGRNVKTKKKKTKSKQAEVTGKGLMCVVNVNELCDK